jgi:hypothetical protein
LRLVMTAQLSCAFVCSAKASIQTVFRSPLNA